MKYLKDDDSDCRQIFINKRVGITWLAGGRWHPVKVRFYGHTWRFSWRYERED